MTRFRGMRGVEPFALPAIAGALVALASFGLAGQEHTYDAQVVDAATGEAIAGAVVTVYERAVAYRRMRVGRSPRDDARLFRTDERGRVSLRGGNWPLVHVRADGFVARWWDWTAWETATPGAPARRSSNGGRCVCSRSATRGAIR